MLQRRTTLRVGRLLLALCLSPLLLLPARAQSPTGAVTFFEPDPATGTSAAAVVDADVPLAHTAQLFPLGPDGRLVGAGDPAAQAAQVLERLHRALAAAGAGLDGLVRLHVYVTDDAVTDVVTAHLAATLPAAVRPAASFGVTDLPVPGAVVAMDAVAVTARPHPVRRVYHVPALGGPPARGHVAVMPPGGRVYLSGQVAAGAMRAATAGTMQSLLASLAYLGLSADDVIQVKAFLHPIADAGLVEETIRAYFRDAPAPPFVAVAWSDGGYLSYLSLDEADGPLPIEIELHAARPPGTPPRGNIAEATSYATPPWLTAPATYSRAAEVHAGRLLYISGLYGPPGDDAETQTRALFRRLEALLAATGSDFDHLVKGTYYVTGPEASEQLNQVRTEYYDPQRAPTSSKMPVRGTGRAGTQITFDMIGVVPEQ